MTHSYKFPDKKDTRVFMSEQ